MQTEYISYFDGGKEFEAYLAYDDSISSKRPAVMIGHDWSGRNQFVCDIAEAIAKLGFIGFAYDMYGKGILLKEKEDKLKIMAPLLEDRNQLQARLKAAYMTLIEQDKVAKDKIAAIGYCFGGLCSLDLVRMGMDLCGAVSFHGNLAQPNNMTRSTIKAKVLVLHGYTDPHVSTESVINLANELDAAKADWQIHMYGNTMHSFTNPEANDPDFGTVYNAKANARSWQAMENFFAEIF